MKKTTYIKLPYVIYEGNTLQDGFNFFTDGVKLNKVIYLRDVSVKPKISMFADTRCNGLWFIYFKKNNKHIIYKMKLC